MIKEIVITGRNNSIDILVKSNKEIVPLTDVTRIQLVDQAGEIDTIDSNDNPEYFDWTTYSSSGKLIFKLGNAGLTAGNYIFRTIIYDAENTDGIFWDRIFITVI